MKRLAFLLALFLSVVPAMAAPHWTVDMGKSKLGFVLPWGKTPFVADFTTWQAAIDFDPADLAHSHVAATIDIGSEHSDDLETDDGLKSDQGFEVQKFPTARFESRSFQHLSGDSYAADGTLTIRGVAKPVHIPFTLTITGDTAHMTGQIQTKWADYGLGQDMGSELPDIGPVVTIHIDLMAKKS